MATEKGRLAVDNSDDHEPWWTWHWQRMVGVPWIILAFLVLVIGGALWEFFTR